MTADTNGNGQPIIVKEQEPSDMVGMQIAHGGRTMRIAGYECEPKRTAVNKSGDPIFWLVDAGERQPPYSEWEQVLCSDIIEKESTDDQLG